MLTSGKLNIYLVEINQQEQVFTKQLKAKNAMERASRINNIWVYDRKIVNK